MHRFSKKFKKGFTLVETLVAISILSISILGTFTVVQTSLQKTTFARDQITAFYLTQEAVEFIRNLRDQNSLNSIKSVGLGGPTVDWLTGLSAVPTDPCYFGKACKIDSYYKTVADCGGASNCGVLNEDPVTGLYGYTAGWTPTHFSRQIQFQNIAAGREVKLIITVSWTSEVFNKTLQVEQLLLNIH